MNANRSNLQLLTCILYKIEKTLESCLIEVIFKTSYFKDFIFVKVFGTIGRGLSFEECNSLLVNVLAAVAVC